MNTRTHTPRHGAMKGFTLVELLVVIGIIALLIGILLPTLSRARQSANNVKCLSNQRQLGLGLAFFANEHDGWLPKAWFNDYPVPELRRAFESGEIDWGYRWDFWGWDLVLKDLDNSNDVFLCPSDPSGIRRGEWNDGSGLRGMSDQELQRDNIPASYRYNISNQMADYRAIKQTDLANASAAMIILDGNASGYHHLNSQSPVTVASGDEAPVGPGKDQIANAAPFRHTGQNDIYRGSGDEAVAVFSLNASFADGHAESVTWEETFKPTGGAIEFIVGDGNPRRTGERAIGIPTMWRQVFQNGSRVDTYDNPNTDADDANQRPG